MPHTCHEVRRPAVIGSHSKAPEMLPDLGRCRSVLRPPAQMTVVNLVADSSHRGVNTPRTRRGPSIMTLTLAAGRTADLPPGEPAEVARNARRPGARLRPDVAAAPAAAPQPPAPGPRTEQEPGCRCKSARCPQRAHGTATGLLASGRGTGGTPDLDPLLAMATSSSWQAPCRVRGEKSPGPAAVRLQVPRGRSCRGPEQHFHITLPRLTRIGLTHTADPATHGQAAEAGQTE